MQYDNSSCMHTIWNGTMAEKWNNFHSFHHVLVQHINTHTYDHARDCGCSTIWLWCDFFPFNNINDDGVEFMRKQKHFDDTKKVQHFMRFQLYVSEWVCSLQFVLNALEYLYAYKIIGFAAQHALIRPESINKSEIQRRWWHSYHHCHQE